MITRTLWVLLLAALATASPAAAGDWEKNQVYALANDRWPSIRGGADCKADLGKFAADNPAYMNPPLMAIGDSLFNGVQSLRINWWLSEWSPPVLVAIRMGLVKEHHADRTGERDFYVPQYPGHGAPPDRTVNFGLHLERPSAGWLDNLFFATSLAGQQRKALSDLLAHRPPNNRAMVDNIAFSGASTLDLLHWTAGDYRDYARADIKGLGAFWPSTQLSHLAPGFTNANAAYVLNPTDSPCLATFTALDHVEARKPKRLLVNIGSNNGVYLVGLFGEGLDKEICNDAISRRESRSGQRSCAPTIRKFLTTQYTADIGKIIGRLSAIPETEFIYINNLALPSQTANLVPDRVKGEKKYRLAFRNEKEGASKKYVSAALVAEADELTRRANAALREAIDRANAENRRKGWAQRFVYVDVSAGLTRYDYKSCFFEGRKDCAGKRVLLDRKRFGLPATQMLDNRPVRAGGSSGFQTGDAFAIKITEGGLFSLDNMHLSSIGYEIMASVIDQSMVAQPDRARIYPNSRPCPDRNETTAEPVRKGDCAGLLTTIGWSFADATRRNFVFARTVGDSEMRNSGFLQSLMAMFK